MFGTDFRKLVEKTFWSCLKRFGLGPWSVELVGVTCPRRSATQIRLGKKKKQDLWSHGTSTDICCILYGAKPPPEITDYDFRIFDSDWFKLYLAQVLAGTHKGKLRFCIVYLESVGDHPSLNFYDTTVSVKIVGALCCLLALPMLVCKIWRVNRDKQHWEDEETGQK